MIKTENMYCIRCLQLKECVEIEVSGICENCIKESLKSTIDEIRKLAKIWRI